MQRPNVYLARTLKQIERYERQFGWRDDRALEEATKTPPELLQRKRRLFELLILLDSDVKELLTEFEDSKSKMAVGELKAAFDSGDINRVKSGFQHLQQLTKSEDGINQTQQFRMVHYEPYAQERSAAPTDPATILAAVSTALFSVSNDYHARKNDLVCRASELDHEAKEIAEANRLAKLKKIAVAHEAIVLKVRDREKELQQAGQLLTLSNASLERAKADTKGSMIAHRYVQDDKQPYRYAPARDREEWQQALAHKEKELRKFERLQEDAETAFRLSRSRFTDAKWNLQEAQERAMSWESAHDYFSGYIKPKAPIGVTFTERAAGTGLSG